MIAWLSIGGALFWFANGQMQATGEGAANPAPQLWNYVSGQRQTAELEFSQKFAAASGDPVFLLDHDGELHQVGELRLVKTTDGRHASRSTAAVKGEALFYPTQTPIPGNASVTYHATDNSIEWVLETMLPPVKREQIALEISQAFEQHHEEIIAALQPIVRDSLYDAMSVIEADFPKAIAERQSEIEKIGGRYQREMVDKQLVPLVKNEIFPIVRKHAEPVAEEVGGKIWKRVSIWRFGWRLAADKLPLTEKTRFQTEWKRFVQKEVVPILEKHSDELVEVTQEIVKDTAQNKKVQDAVRNNLKDIVEDEEIQKLLWEIIREVIVDNPRMKVAMEKHWKGPKAHKALEITGRRLQPTVQRIGKLLFGNLNEGVTPEFRAVLRNQILGKDKRWFLITLPEKGTETHADRLIFTVKPGNDEVASPFLVDPI
ncbi:MAG: hypothetical protein CMJ78_27280 [Planctomycetaceae bacterium]|nr:hypothetical protein [Planctomycetaceae bacterium]